MRNLSEAQRLRIGIGAAAVVIVYGVAQVADIGWAIVAGVGAVALVAAAALLGNRLGARRASGN